MIISDTPVHSYYVAYVDCKYNTKPLTASFSRDGINYQDVEVIKITDMPNGSENFDRMKNFGSGTYMINFPKSSNFYMPPSYARIKINSVDNFCKVLIHSK